MSSNNGVTSIRLRGSNPGLSTMLPGLNTLSAQCATLGSFIDEAIRYLASARLSIMTIDYHAGTGELTLMVRG